MGVKELGRFCGTRRGKSRKKEGEATGGLGHEESEGSGAGLLGQLHQQMWRKVPEARSASLRKTGPRGAGTISLGLKLYPGNFLNSFSFQRSLKGRRHGRGGRGPGIDDPNLPLLPYVRMWHFRTGWWLPASSPVPAVLSLPLDIAAPPCMVASVEPSMRLEPTTRDQVLS